MGRPNKPSAQHATAGNPGKRARNRQEPDPDYLDDHTPPAWLSVDAAKVWAEYAPKMRKAKILTVVDVEPFGRWCELVVRYRVVKSDLARSGVMIPREGDVAAAAVKGDGKDAGAGKAGAQDKAAKPRPSHVVNQLVFVESMLLKQLLAVEREFGMTPAARTRVQIEPQLTLFPDDAQPGAAHKRETSKGASYFTGAGAPH